MPSSHLILCHPLLLLPPIPPHIRVFSNESTLCMRWPKYWSFSFNISPSNEHPGLISFRMDWLDLLAVQETLKSLLQHHNSKASILRHSAFFTVQLSHLYMTTGKTIVLYKNNLSIWIYFLIYRNRHVTQWNSLMPSFIQPANISWELVRQAVLQILGLSQSRDKVSALLELKFSWRRWKTSLCICNKVSVLIHANEENGAEHEKALLVLLSCFSWVWFCATP